MALRAFLDDFADDDTGDRCGRRRRARATARTTSGLTELAEQLLATNPAATVAAFRAWLAATGGDDDAERRDAVELLTFHAAKGLEWPVVIVAGSRPASCPTPRRGGEHGASRGDPAPLRRAHPSRARPCM